MKQKNSLAMNVTVNLPSVNGYVRFVLSDHVEKRLTKFHNICGKHEKQPCVYLIKVPFIVGTGKA